MRSRWLVCGRFGAVALSAMCLSIDAQGATLHVPGNYATIQAAISAATDGDVVLVAPGVYHEAINFLGKAITVRSAAGAHATTIDATGLNSSVVRFVNLERLDSVLSGFTITGGIAQDTLIGGGGGARLDGGSPTIMNCRFVGNRTAGAAFLHGLGGGVGVFFSFPTLINCTFVGNRAGDGGALAVYKGWCTLINCTMHANLAVAGGSATTSFDGQIETRNCIIWGNPGMPFNKCCVDPTYSNLQESIAGQGNINSDPMFVAPAHAGGDGQWGTNDDFYGDLRLAAGSPCTDAANNSAVPPGATLDILGRPRFIDDPNVQDTGAGMPPIIDMGAYERQLPCAADIAPAAAPNGTVNIDDLLLVITGWGPCPLPPTLCPADVNATGAVNIDDLLAVINGWGACP